MNLSRRAFSLSTLLAAPAALTGALLPAAAFADKAPVWTPLGSNLALRGYDPVAYFRAGRPVQGLAQFSTRHQGAEFRFSTAANRDAFVAAPARYAPQYGGYCAWAVSQGYTAGVDPQAWRIVDGRLYLNYNRDIQRRWESDIPGHIAAANRNWPGVLRG